MTDERIARLDAIIRDVPDFPKPGIVFKDITPLLADPKAFEDTLALLDQKYADDALDAIVGIESRGFIFGAALAARRGIGFVPVRKPGKLPAETYEVEYELEYGTDRLQIHTDALEAGQRVLIVDDLIATGGTAWASAELVRKAGGEVIGFAFVIELTFLNGADRLRPHRVETLIRY